MLYCNIATARSTEAEVTASTSAAEAVDKSPRRFRYDFHLHWRIGTASLSVATRSTAAVSATTAAVSATTAAVSAITAAVSATTAAVTATKL